MSKTQTKRYRSSKSRTRKIGGSVLASGGFGCVFSPALLCKGQTKRKRNTVSKLMTEKHALEEYHDISSIKDRVKSIPNYKDYFLVDDISVCTPKALSAIDLSNFKKCIALDRVLRWLSQTLFIVLFIEVSRAPTYSLESYHRLIILLILLLFDWLIDWLIVGR